MDSSKKTLSSFFVEMEHRLLKKWVDEGVIKEYLEKNSHSDKHFSFQDGPITANNPMGVHHAWGRTYKDLFQRFHNLTGFKQRFQNGFDCQGLWVEVEVEKELGLKSKKDIENLVPGDRTKSIAKFVELCKERVKKYANIQTEQSKRLAYFMDWENSYFTMNEDNNYMIWLFLKKCYENGWIYKGKESVPWCPRCETAISQHEMLTEDYKEITHDSVYMQFKLLDPVKHGLKDINLDQFLVVWTTTPWTIPANIAVAVDSNVDYSLIKHKDVALWVAKDRVKALFGDDSNTLITVKGKDLLGRKYIGLFDDLEIVKKTFTDFKHNFHTVIPTDPAIMPISTTDGTGLVHTAVSAGTEDFKLGRKLGLPMIPVIEDNADYLPHMGRLAGKNAKNDPWIILGELKQRTKNGENLVFKIEKIKHRYPGCWRCKAELVWKVADEWYIAMEKKIDADKDKRTLRERMIDVAKKISWMPSFGLDRELDWLKNMHDWLISKKNRYWGLALPIYECKKCEYFEVLGSYNELKNKASSGWEKFAGHTPHKPYIDEVKIKCAKCTHEMERIGDVGNPWLDAGIVPYSTIKEQNVGEPLYISDKQQWKKWFPANFITESFPGQFKNWFYAMIAMSTVLEDTAPFERVLGFATLTAEDGRPMHKSWGNSIAFEEGADIIGVDVMRWLYARQNPADNLLFGYNKADEVRRSFYLILWNSFKFYIQNSEADKIKFDDSVLKGFVTKSVLDKYILARLHQTEISVKKGYEKYEPKSVTVSIESFVADFSTWFLRRSRDRVSATALSQEDKESFYKVCQYIFYNLSIIISPITPFIADEIYTVLTSKKSVHLECWPKIHSEFKNSEIISDMNTVRKLAEVGHRVRKDLKLKVRQPLNKVSIRAFNEMEFGIKENTTQYIGIISAELNVKKVELQFDTKSDDQILINLDTELTPELKLEGELRDIIREIQLKRKELGLGLSDGVDIIVPKKFASFEDIIRAAVLSRKIKFEEILSVEKSQ